MKGKRVSNFLISMGLVAAMTLAPFSEICVTATDTQEVAENAAGETSQGLAPAVDQETPKTEETNPASEPEQAQQADPAQQGETEAGSSQPEGEAETETKEADPVLEEGIRTEESEEQEPEEEVLTVEEGADGTFTVRLAKDSVPAGAVKVLFPTWSETKKQDDLIWYEGKKEADGSYTCKIDLGRHRHLGRFITHAYYEDKAGKKVIIAGTTFEVEVPTGKLEIVPGSLNYKAGTVRLRMTGIEGASMIKKVEFPTWSLNKKPDAIRWYEGSRAAIGDYI